MVIVFCWQWFRIIARHESSRPVVSSLLWKAQAHLLSSYGDQKPRGLSQDQRQKQSLLPWAPHCLERPSHFWQFVNVRSTPASFLYKCFEDNQAVMAIIAKGYIARNWSIWPNFIALTSRAHTKPFQARISSFSTSTQAIKRRMSWTRLCQCLCGQVFWICSAPSPSQPLRFGLCLRESSCHGNQAAVDGPFERSKLFSFIWDLSRNYCN